MSRIFILTNFLFLILASNTQAYPLNEMELIGKGEAYYLKFIKVYDAALYSEAGRPEADILSPTISKCLILDYDVPISSKDFVKAANTILLRQFTEEQLDPLKAEIEQIHNSYRDVQSGDTYGLCYNGESGETTLHHNGEETVRIASKDFAQVYFSIWLGENGPLDHKLRNNLLTKAASR